MLCVLFVLFTRMDCSQNLSMSVVLGFLNFLCVFSVANRRHAMSCWNVGITKKSSSCRQDNFIVFIFRSGNKNIN